MRIIGKAFALVGIIAILTWIVFFLVAVFSPFFGNYKLPFIKKNCYGIFMERNILDAQDTTFEPYCLGITMYEL